MAPRYTKEQATAQLAKRLADVMHPVLFPVEQQCMQIQAKNWAVTETLAEIAAAAFIMGTK